MSHSPSSDPLRAFLWGKRSAIRHPLALAVEVQGAQRPVRATSLDLSAGGMLLRFDTAELASHGDIDPFVLTETHFRGDCVARFKRTRLKVHLELVRLDYRPDEPEYLYVGFRFARPLAEKQLRKLGLQPSHCGPEAHGLPSDLVDLRASQDPVVCHLFNAGDLSRPMFEGIVAGAGPRSLCVMLESADLALVGKRLRNTSFRVDVLEGDRSQWHSEARLQAIGLLDKPEGALELGLVVEDKPTAALRGKLVPNPRRRAG